MNERLTSLERIRGKKDFSSLYRNGSRLRGRYFDLVFRPSQSGTSRVAVVVSRKVGSAVTRNKVKRRIRDLFRRNKAVFTEPMDVIIVTRKEVQDLSASELQAGYFQALESIKKKRTPS